ncbi:unnamed protein product [Durusdinium trenchii]|uniref:Alcohol dehydrogenase-like C-terminal domain-containing protein n=1 Tax=Durusdinium trenchii TaxID=1381693 RepID=A0ABP0P7T9_9DINO
MSMQGKQHLCEEGTFMGAGGTRGCFADFVCVSSLQLVRLPASIPMELAMMTEPLSVALHTLKLAEKSILSILDGDVAILGAGAIGLCHLLLLKHVGAKNVHIIDPLEDRRTMSLRLGARSAHCTQLATAELRQLVGRKGCELVLDCAGTEQSFKTALQVAGLAAQVVLVGIPEVDFLQYNPHVARTKELSILNARRANQTLQACLNLLVHSEQLRERCAQIVTHRMPLEKVQAAFEMASSYQGGAVKIAILPELDTLSFQSIGLIAGTPHSVAYLQHLLEEKMIVKLVALDLDIWDVTSEVQELCRVHGIPQFALDDLPAFAKDIHFDLLIDAGASAALGQPPATPWACASVRTTLQLPHWPLEMALLGGPCGGASLLGEDSIVDIYMLEGGDPPLEIRKALDMLSAQAALRFPAWLKALQDGSYDMSMLHAWRASKPAPKHCAAPNQGCVQ